MGWRLPGQVDPPGVELDEEQHVEPAQPDGALTDTLLLVVGLDPEHQAPPIPLGKGLPLDNLAVVESGERA